MYKRNPLSLNTAVIADEEQYDGFYAVCTDLEEIGVEQIVSINKKRIIRNTKKK